MKTFLFIAAASLSLLAQQETKLRGVYKVYFDKGQQSYQMTFSDSTFVKKMPDAITYKGKIAYGKYVAVVRKNMEDDPIEIDNREFGKDTIKFSTKSKRDNSMTVNRGKMIRLKQ